MSEEYTHIHVAGHMKAYIEDEGVEEILLSYKHLTDPLWQGVAGLSKAEFCDKWRPIETYQHVEDDTPDDALLAK